MTTRKTTAAAETVAAANQSELSSVLLDVLRNLNREAAQTTLALDDKAKAAISRYRAIANDLFVLPENSINTGSSLSGAPRA